MILETMMISLPLVRDTSSTVDMILFSLLNVLYSIYETCIEDQEKEVVLSFLKCIKRRMRKIKMIAL